MPRQLVDHKLDDSFRFSWDCFLELHERRTSNGYSMNPLLWQEIYYWTLLTGVELTRNELNQILAIDKVYMETLQKNREKNK